MNEKIYYGCLIVLATFLSLLMDLGIPIIIAGFYALIFNQPFSWIAVILIYIIIQTYLNVKNITELFFNMVNKKNGN